LYFNAHENIENNKYWSIGSPHVAHEVSPYEVEVGVHYLMNVRRIIGLLFYSKIG
jgi:hypothetical protein